jgi:peptidoglycan/LPS O-acetylase OafA/YrhL
VSTSAPAADAGATSRASGRHLPALDGVRAVAATAVLLTHVGFATGAVRPSVVGAVVARLDIGVALFFALSGFLMLRPWIVAAVDGTQPRTSVRRYARSRAARILPVYWVVTTVVLALEAARVFGPTLRSPLRVDLHEVLVHAVVGQGLTGDFFTSYSQTWSLTTELTFYLVVPLVGVLLVRRAPVTVLDRKARLRRVRWGCAAVMLLGVAVAGYAASSLPWAGGRLSTSLLGHCAWFAAGAWVFAGTLTSDPLDRFAALRRQAPDRLVAAAGLLFLLASSPLGGNLLFEQASAWQAAAREGLYTAVAILLLTAASAERVETTPVGRFLASAPLHWVGTRSYALFLCHLPVLFAVMTVLGLGLFEGSFVLVASITLLLSLGLADLSWRYLERPVLHWARRRDERDEG